MANRPFIGLTRKDLVSRILAGDTLAIAEGAARNASRERKGKSRVKAYDAPAPAPTSDLAGIPRDVLLAAVERFLLNPPAGVSLTDTPLPTCVAPAVPNPDVQVWHATLADCDGSRWAAYARLADAGWKHRRIAEAAGVTPGSVSNAVSKHRRGIAPDLSFAGK